MTDINITCQQCGHLFTATDSRNSLHVPCPSCGSNTPVPGAGDNIREESIPPKLRVRRDRPVGSMPMKQCPKCGKDAVEDAVLCVQCGYNWATGKSMHTNKHSPILSAIKMLFMVVLALIVAGVSLYSIWIVFFDDETERPYAAMEQEPPVSIEEKAYEALTVEEKGETVDRPVSLREPAEDGETPQEEVKEEVVEEPEAAVDVNRKKEELRQSLTASLDERFPLYSRGDQVVLEQRNGLVHRGRLVGVSDGDALLIDGEFRIRAALDDLTVNSRLQVDEGFRDQMIEDRLLRELENQGLL